MWHPAFEHGRRGKQPYYVRRTDGQPMALAALYGRAPVRAAGDREDTVVIVTCEPRDGLEQIHNRMPLELLGRWVG